MQTLFKDLADLMKDRQELRMNVKKIGEELVVVVTPDFKEGSKNIQLSGTPAEMDEHFISELNKPLAQIKTGFTSNAQDVAKEIEVEQKEEEEGQAKSPKKSESKKPDNKAKKKKSGKNDKVLLSTKKVAEPKQEPKEETPEPLTESAEKTPKTVNITAVSRDLVTEGKGLFADRKYEEARDKFKAALDIDPSNETAKKEMDNAEKWVKAIQRLKPTNTEDNGTTSQNS